MFKNTLVFQIIQWDRHEAVDIEARLDAARFSECGATQAESAGWVEPRGEKHGTLVESVGRHLLLKLCTETKAVPGSAVKNRLDLELDKIEAQTGRRPKGKQTKEIREGIIHELLPRAFPKRSMTWVWIDPQARLLVVDAASVKKADGVVSRLVECLGGGIVLKLLQTRVSPATAMSEWLQSKEAPAGFTVDRECELKQPDSEKASVRYARHMLDIDEVAAHVTQGKVPVQLAMTWESRVSFILTESLALKKIKLLDVVIEGKEAADEFDTDAALVTGEMSRLIADLAASLGGELDRDPLPQPPAGQAASPAQAEEPMPF